MLQILICVEGQTEETFIKEVIQPFLLKFNIFITPTIINTKIVKGGNNFKGGLNSYSHLKRDILNLLKNQNIFVTSFIDYYGLPKDFPAYNQKNSLANSYERVLFLEKEFSIDIDNSRFIPYIQLHEFEALLFSSINGFNEYYQDKEIILKNISNIISKYPNPEDINDDPYTAPSKRIIKIIPEYEKILMGSLISLHNGINNILEKCPHGINNILEKCPHFREWIYKIKSLVE